MNNRNFDNWNRYLDNDGNILRGCIQFMVLDGTTSAPIFDSDGVALSNPQITDIYGRTQHQVFIKNDVLVYFYKYVGQGTIEDEEAQGIDTSDETKWSLQYTAESQLTVDLSGSTDSIKSVEDMTALHALDPATIPATGDKKFIQLMGYYEEGDLEPAYYWWDETSTENDDGGSIIAGPELTGRWKLIPPAVHLDVRRFGAFPYSSTYQVDSQRVKIMNAVTYANRVGLRVWFPRHEETTPNVISYKYYKYDNLNITFQNGLDVDYNVIFLDEGTASTFRFPSIRGDLYFQNANTSVGANFVKASWNMRSNSKYSQFMDATYVIDDMNHSTNIRSLQDYTVDCRAFPIYGFTFNNCRLSETRKLAGKDGVYNTFVNCKLTGKMFYTGEDDNAADLVGLCNGCKLDIMDFQDELYLWRSWRCTDNYDMNIDWQNLPVDGGPYSNYAGSTLTGTVLRICNYKHYFGSRIVLPQTGNVNTIILENCEGYFSLPSNMTVQLNNCNAYIRMARGVNLIAVDSNVCLDGTNYSSGTLPTYNFRNCVVQNTPDAAASTSYVTTSLTAIGCILNVGFTADNTVVKDSQINKSIVTEFNDNTGNAVFYDNNIVNAAFIIRGPSTGKHHVRGAWTNNTGNVQDPIFINRENLDSVEANHPYTYENNSGTFLPRMESKQFARRITFMDIPTMLATQVRDDYMVAKSPSGQSWNWMFIYTDNLYDDQHNYENGISGPIQIFSIGTDDFICRVHWTIYSFMAATSFPNPENWFTTMDFPMVAKFISGYGWKLVMRRFPGGQDSNRTSRVITGIWHNGGSAAGTYVDAMFKITRGC